MKQVFGKAQAQRDVHIRPFRKLAVAATIIAAGIFSLGCPGRQQAEKATVMERAGAQNPVNDAMRDAERRAAMQQTEAAQHMSHMPEDQDQHDYCR
ncbi:MAG: hypothetical protein PHV13_05965 [Candidatus ainarchaeum sp.]|nr:hypothetical protein [Candidatus ainarchaeum sp.]